MENLVIKKSELLQFYENQTKTKTLDERVKLPNDEINVRVKKSDVEDFVINGLDHKGWLEIVPAQRNTKKIYKVTQDQFGLILMTQLAKKSENTERIEE
jgi:hypothetical protein